MNIDDAVQTLARTVDWEKLKKRWNLPTNTENLLFDKEFQEYWIKYPRQRPGQVLINLGKIPDQENAWDDEYLTILATCRKGQDACINYDDE